MKGGSRLMTLQLPEMAPSEVRQAEMLSRQSFACATTIYPKIDFIDTDFLFFFP